MSLNLIKPKNVTDIHCSCKIFMQMSHLAGLQWRFDAITGATDTYELLAFELLLYYHVKTVFKKIVLS